MKTRSPRPATPSAPTPTLRVLLAAACLFLCALVFHTAISTAAFDVTRVADTNDGAADAVYSAGASGVASPTTFTVTKVADTNDGVCDSDCSLREAILAANANPGLDTINFNITAGVAPFVIQPTFALPTITDPVVIDGYSQPGASPNTLAVGDDAVIAIVLNGASAGFTSGLSISAGNSTVRGLAIVRFSDVGISLQTKGGNTISGNFIGVQPDGTTGAGNGGGVSISGSVTSNSSSNIIGGAAPADRNIISASTNGDGITVSNGRSTVIKGNYIGTDKTGAAALGNKSNGVKVTQASNLTVIGGRAAGEGNRIAFNQQNGIIVTQGGFGNPDRVTMAGNSIFSNTKLGIDLGNNGVTANDSCDADGDVNGLQNFPLIASADSASDTVITGFLNSKAGQTYTLDFYSSDACDASGFGEGKTYLGSTTVTTDAGCKTNFSATLPVALAAGQFITATATDSAGNTSEFSDCFQVNAAPRNLVDLILTASAAPSPAFFGNELTYTLTVTNNGGASAHNVALTDTLGVGVSFASASPGCSPSGSSLSGSGITVTCDLGVIPPDSNSVATIVVVPTFNGLATSTIGNRSSVTSSDTEVIPADNSRTISTTVNQPLALRMTAAPNPVLVGNNVTFTASVANNGAATVSNLALAISFSGTFVSATPGCAQSGQAVNCSIATLAGGASTSIQVVATQNSTSSGSAAATLTAPNFGTLNDSARVNVVDTVPNTVNYVFTTATNGSLTDMSSGTTPLLGENTDNGESPPQDIGFDFYFFSDNSLFPLPVRYTQFSVNSNGSLRLSSFGFVNNSKNFTPLSNAGDSVFPIFAPFASDQKIGAGGKVHYKTVGAAPNRVLVVEWLNMQSHPSDAAAGLTYQLRLYETSGVIEFAYGSMTMSAAGAANTKPQIGFANASTGGSLGTVSAPQADTPFYIGFTNTPVNNVYAAGPINVLDSAADGARRVFTFTPPVPAAPSNLNFTNVTQTSLRVNWTDNSTNEDGFVIYRSTDGTNFIFAGSAGRNATSANLSPLDADTNYTFRVYAVSESGLSQFAAASQTTLAPGNFISTAAGGDWSSPSTWTNNAVPTANDNVQIVSGATVVIDGGSPKANDLTVDGTLEFSSTAATTLSAHTVLISPGGIFRSANTGTALHTLNLSGNLTNNGTLDFSTNANTSGVNIVFFGGTTDAVFGGAGATTNVRTIDVEKNVELKPANFTVRGTTNETSNGFVTFGRAVLKISGSFPGTHRTFVNTDFFNTGVQNFSEGSLWLANPNFNVAFPGALATSGLLRVSAGTFTAQSLTVTKTLIEGGAINVGTFSAKNLGTDQSQVSYTQSGGTLTTGIGTSGAVFQTNGFPLTPVMAMSGGTIVLQGGISTQSYSVSPAFTTLLLTGGTVQFGNAASGGARQFNVTGTLPNMTIDNTGGNHTVNSITSGNTTVLGNVNIGAGTTLFAGGGTGTFRFQGGTFANNGTLIVSNNTSTAPAPPFTFNGAIPQTYTGSGAASFFIVNVDNPRGLTIDPASPNPVITRINLFRGTITNSNKLTIGQGGTSLAVVSFGGSSLTTAPGGSFDVTPNYNLGVNGLHIFYQQEGAPRTTGAEIPASRTLRNMFVGNTNGVIISGGDLTLDAPTTAQNRQLVLQDGTVSTGANTLIVKPSITVTRTNGYVVGNLQMEYNAPGGKTFHVGTANGYSPVTANVTALAQNPSSLTVRATQGAHPQLNAASSLGRYWTITKTGDLTATLTFNYLQTDVHGAESAYLVNRITGGQIDVLQPPAATVDTSANTATVTGVSDFSDWTLGGPATANQPPVARCHDVVKTGDNSVTPEEVNAGSSDPDGAYLTLALSPPGPYPTGTTAVTLTVTDDQGASSQCTANVTINRATPTVNWNNPAGITYGTRLGAAQLNATASFNGTDVPGTFTYTPAAGALLRAGSGQTLHVEFTPADAADFTTASKDVSINVGKALLTVTADDKTRAYGDPNPPLTFHLSGFANGEDASSAGVTGAPALSTAADNFSTVTGGPYPISIAIGSLSAPNYNFTLVSGSLSVTRAQLTATVDNQSRAYGDPNPPLTYTLSGVKNSDAVTLTTTTTADQSSPVGTYPITVAISGAPSVLSNYAPPSPLPTATLTVTPAPLTITVDDASRAYGDPNPTFTGTFTGVKNNDGLTVSYHTAATQASNVGTYPITVTINDPSNRGGNYSVPQPLPTGTLTVTKAPLTITAANQSRTYGAPNPPLTGQIAGLKNGDAITAAYTTAAVANSSVGTYDIVPQAIDSSPPTLGNYAVSLVNGVLTVTKATATIHVSAPAGVVYDAQPHPATATVTGVFGEDLGAPSITYAPGGASAPVNAGSYGVAVSYAGDGNYLPASDNSATISIAQATPAVSVTGGTFTYDAQPHAATGTVAGVGGEDLGALTFTYDGSPDAPVNAGSYSVIGSYAGSQNYSPASATTTIVINKATPLINWATPADVVYGTALGSSQLNATATRGAGGPAVAGSFAYTPGAGSVLHAGAQTLGTQFTPDDAANYNGASAQVTLNVTKAPLTVKADDKTKVYGAALPPFTATPSGFVNGDTVSGLGGTLAFTTPATASSGAGTYAITPGGLTSADYAITFADGTLTITKATLTATADNKSKVYGQGNPVLTASYTGFVNGDGVSSLAGSPALSATAEQLSDVGSYPISVAQGSLSSANYSFTFVGGTLSVTKAEQTISWSDPTPIIYGTALSDTQLNATVAGVPGGTPPGGLTYSTLAATPAAGVVLHAGAHQPLTVNAAATQNYNAATKTVHLDVQQATPVINWNTPAAITYGTALGATQLNATATHPTVSGPLSGTVVSGAFVYTPAAGAVLPVGNDTLSVTFTPANTADYTTATKSVVQRVNYGVCVLYDQTKAAKSGSTIPIKLELCDASGVNLSSQSVVVKAIGVRLISAVAWGDAQDAGNANPDSDFRYTSGMYMYNLKTTGLATGTYQLGFVVGNDPAVYTVQFQIR